jgi:hypothetical protein
MPSVVAQRLKGLNDERFEELCYALLREEYPLRDIKRVHGVGGDKGIDIFSGHLEQGPIVWQCKCFRNTLGASQKRQVEQSIQAVLRHFTPVEWVLMVPIDLTIEGHEWFEKVQGAHQGIRVRLFQASDFEQELMWRPSLRERFFPEAELSPSKIKALITKAGDASACELAHQAAETLRQCKLQLRGQDARLDYQITFPRESRFPDLRVLSDQIPPNGLLATLIDQEKRVDIFARDVEGLRRDPPSVKFSIAAAALEKFQRAVSTGSAETFGPEEVLDVRLPPGFLAPEEMKPVTLVLSSSAATSKKRIYIRVRFRAGDDQVLFDRIRFRIARAGTEELELVSAPRSPLKLSFVLGRDRQIHFTLSTTYAGKDAATVGKLRQVYRILEKGADLELYDIKKRTTFVTASARPIRLNEDWRKRDELIDAVVEIAAAFNARIRWPKSLTMADVHVIRLFSRIIREGRAPFPGDTLTLTLRKDSRKMDAFLGSVETEAAYALTFPRLNPPPRVLGAPLNTGPCTIYLRRAAVIQPQETKDRYEAAEDGEGVAVQYRLLETPEIVFHRFAAGRAPEVTQQEGGVT